MFNLTPFSSSSSLTLLYVSILFVSFLLPHRYILYFQTHFYIFSIPTKM
nr:MAG TPA: hypothetical protein [Caudoviricetes sp.]